ncbi:MAG: hypothetical protein KF708_23360 [Pirellulales bacterium]|nr:hypothetical protein [Pirellulales bacterium]
MPSIRTLLCWSLGLLAVSVSISGAASAGEVIYHGEYSPSVGGAYGEAAFISDGDSCTSCASTGGDASCCESDGEGGCSKGCGLGCGRCCKRQRASAQESWYNCGCNGSYKFPVPPLYTYMWPGLYSQQLVTDYHSPWRFPPLRPYTNEAPTGEPFESASSRRTAVRQVSAQMPVAGGAAQSAIPTEGKRLEPTSERIRRLYDVR